MDWPRAIVHIDMDAFFVSVERKRDPSLAGRPVIVGGGRDGDLRRAVVAACSYETRPFGVRSAMPMAQALRLCPEAIVIPPGTADYAAETRKVAEIIASFTDLFEMTSPDEAFVDLAGTFRLHGPPPEAAHRLRLAIAKGTGLPVSAGLGTSKTVAKIASKLSKPQGLFAVLPGGEAAFLRPQPLDRMPGLGPKTREALERRGVRTLGDLAGSEEESLAAWLGDHRRNLRERALGHCRSAVEPDRERAQASTERTYAEDAADPAVIRADLAAMASKIGASLRRMGKWAGTATLKIRFPDFTTLTRQAPLHPPTQDDRAILRAAERLLRRTWDGRTPLRLLGLGAANLTATAQPDLFASEEDARSARLLRAVDGLRANFGRDAVRWAGTIRPEPGGRSLDERGKGRRR